MGHLHHLQPRAPSLNQGGWHRDVTRRARRQRTKRRAAKWCSSPKKMHVHFQHLHVKTVCRL